MLTSLDKFYNKLSCRKETVRLLRGSVLAKYNWKTIFCGHYRFIFNHCKAIKFGEITQNKGYYAIQSYSRSPMSVPIESPYATCYWWLILTDILSRTVSNLSQKIVKNFGRKRPLCVVYCFIKYRTISIISDTWTFFARCYGWGATSDYRLKIGVVAPSGSVWPKISSRRRRPHQPFFLSEN